MILYCDSSALVKLYVKERESDVTRGLLAEAELVATSRISWVELHAAFARRSREVPTDHGALQQAREALRRDWPRYLLLEVTQALAELAADYADTFALRAYDSIQLASAAETRRHSAREVVFACFDHRLSRAAKVLGMRVPFLPP